MGGERVTTRTEEFRARYVRPAALIGTAGLVGLHAVVFGVFDSPYEDGLKTAAEWSGDVAGVNMPWEHEEARIDSFSQPGQIAVNSKILKIHNRVEARASLSSVILGDNVISETKSYREGVIVSRVHLDGIPYFDTDRDDNSMLITRLHEGADVGIPLDSVRFDMMQPQTGRVVNNGDIECEINDPNHPKYTGCVEAEPIRIGAFAGLPIIGEEHPEDIELAAEQIFDQWAQIDPCHIEEIFIPTFDAIYDQHGLPRIGNSLDPASEVVKTLIRYHYRRQFAPSTPPQEIFFNFSGSYTPILPLRDRMTTLAEQVDYPLDATSDSGPRHCVTGNGSLSAHFGGVDPVLRFTQIAVGGAEKVPEDFDIRTGEYKTGLYPEADLSSTSLGERIRNILGGN